MISASQRTTIDRLRLDARFARALAYPVTVVVGEIGSGKSIAVGNYLDRSAIPYVRYAVEAETTPQAFVQGFAAAIAPLAPGAILTASIAFDLALKGASPWTDLAAWLKEHVRNQAATIVVDGLAESDGRGAIAELLTTLVEETQPHLRWVLVGRDFGAFPIASWLAHRVADIPIDAGDLRFSLDDAAAVALLHERPHAPLASIVDHLRGWPLGVTFAIDALARAGDLAAVPSDHRDALAHFARVALAGRDGAELDFLRAAAALPDLDPAVLTALDPLATANMFEPLRAEHAWMFTPSDPPRMRNEVRRVLAELAPSRSFATADLARALEGAGRWADAIGLLLETDIDAVAELIERHGLALIDEGRLDIVDAALGRLSQTAHAERPVVLGLRALAASELGHFDSAEAWFRMAIAGSEDSTQRLGLAYRFALDAMRRNRPESVERLASLFPGDPLHATPTELSMRATLATAYAVGEKHDQAEAAMEAVLRALDGSVPAATVARILHQGAFVAVRRRDHARAKILASRAIAVAETINAYDVIARATTVLVELSREADDPIASLHHLEEFARFGLLSGNPQMRVFGLLAALDVETERGNIEAIETIVLALGGRELVQHERKINESLLPAEAMRHAWTGDFERAYGLIVEAGKNETRRSERAGRYAELALYAALTGRSDEAHTALDQSEHDVVRLSLISLGGRTFAILALCALVLGDTERSRRLVATARDEGFAANLRNAAFLWTIDALVEFTEQNQNTDTLHAALTELDLQELGGYRLLIEAIPAKTLSRSA